MDLPAAMSSYSNMYSALCCNPDTCRGATGRRLVALLVPPTGGRIIHVPLRRQRVLFHRYSKDCQYSWGPTCVAFIPPLLFVPSHASKLGRVLS